MAGGVGNRGQGRPKGSKNKDTVEIEQKLARLNCCPIKGMAIIATNKLPCGVCRGKLETKYKLPEGAHAAGCPGGAECTCKGIGRRVCESCYGDGYEACSPELRGKMYAELAQYVAPKRKAIELSGSVDTPDLAGILRGRYERSKEPEQCS